jgi:hypothetical protein
MAKSSRRPREHKPAAPSLPASITRLLAPQAPIDGPEIESEQDYARKVVEAFTALINERRRKDAQK